LKIGSNIKIFRKKMKLTQTALANIVNKSESSIQKYESGAVTPDFETLNKIAEALGCSLKDLINDSAQFNLVDNYPKITHLIGSLPPEELFASSGKVFNFPDNNARMAAIQCLYYLMGIAGIDQEEQKNEINSLYDFQIMELLTELSESLKYELFKLKNK